MYLVCCDADWRLVVALTIGVATADLGAAIFATAAAPANHNERSDCWYGHKFYTYTYPQSLITLLSIFFKLLKKGLWNMVSYIKEGMQAKGIWKQNPEANI